MCDTGLLQCRDAIAVDARERHIYGIRNTALRELVCFANIDHARARIDALNRILRRYRDSADPE